MKEVEVLKKRELKLLYIWLNNYQRDTLIKESEIEYYKKRMALIEQAIKEKEKQEIKENE